MEYISLYIRILTSRYIILSMDPTCELYNSEFAVMQTHCPAQANEKPFMDTNFEINLTLKFRNESLS